MRLFGVLELLRDALPEPIVRHLVIGVRRIRVQRNPRDAAVRCFQFRDAAFLPRILAILEDNVYFRSQDNVSESLR